VVHVIDAANSFPLEGVVVEDGPGSSVTTVQIVDGGEVGGGVLARGSSRVEMTGGRVTGGEGFTMEDNSSFSMSGGWVSGIVYNSPATSEIFSSAQIWSKGISMTAGTLNVAGGSVGGASFISGAVVNISGGQTDNWLVFDSGELFVSGGVHRRVEANVGSVAHITRGTITTVHGWFSGRSFILGGAVETYISSREGGTVEIYGGSISGELAVFDTSSLTIRGSTFSLPFGPVANTTGTILGTLGDGTLIDVPFSRASTRQSPFRAARWGRFPRAHRPLRLIKTTTVRTGRATSSRATTFLERA
jgi:hypothetical protein